MEAGFGKVEQLRGACIRLDFVTVHAVQEGARRVRAVSILIRQRRAIVFSVPPFARYHAGVAADTGIQVDHEAELFLCGLWQFGHVRFRFADVGVGASPDTPGIFLSQRRGYLDFQARVFGAAGTGDFCLGVVGLDSVWGGGFLDPDFEVEPSSLACDRVSVGPAQAVALGGRSSWIR